MDIDAVWHDMGDDELERRPRLRRGPIVKAEQCARCGGMLTEAEIVGDEHHDCEGR